MGRMASGAEAQADFWRLFAARLTLRPATAGSLRLRSLRLRSLRLRSGQAGQAGQGPCRDESDAKPVTVFREPH